jgi:hypothetical protein
VTTRLRNCRAVVWSMSKVSWSLFCLRWVGVWVGRLRVSRRSAPHWVFSGPTGDRATAERAAATAKETMHNTSTYRMASVVSSVGLVLSLGGFGGTGRMFIDLSALFAGRRPRVASQRKGVTGLCETPVCRNKVKVESSLANKRVTQRFPWPFALKCSVYFPLVFVLPAPTHPWK